jgi:predicted transcriptional regulator
MRLKDIIDELEFSVLGGAELIEREVLRGYASDLMSDVIAHGEIGDIWITMQVHMNVVAVAAMKEVAAVVLSGGRQPAEDVAQKAAEQDVIILGSDLPTYEIVGRLHRLGVGGI